MQYICHRRKLAEFFGHAPHCTVTRTIDIEPGLSLLKEEYSIGKIIRLDDQRYNRLVEFAKDGEPIMDLIDRLLDAATSTAK